MIDMIHINDKDIIASINTRKEDGFRMLVEKYREPLYYHIRRILILHEDTDDALQNTFLKVWENISGFRADSSIYTWIYRIATNEALAILRKINREKIIETGVLEYLQANSKDAGTWFDGDAAYVKLINAVVSLPEKQQLVFNMRYFEQMKYNDISKILGTSVGALKASYHHARKKIEEYLKND